MELKKKQLNTNQVKIDEYVDNSMLRKRPKEPIITKEDNQAKEKKKNDAVEIGLIESDGDDDIIVEDIKYPNVDIGESIFGKSKAIDKVQSSEFESKLIDFDKEKRKKKIQEARENEEYLMSLLKAEQQKAKDERLKKSFSKLRAGLKNKLVNERIKTFKEKLRIEEEEAKRVKEIPSISSDGNCNKGTLLGAMES